MKTGILSKQELEELFTSIITEDGGKGEGTRVYVPVENDGRTWLDEFSPDGEIFYNYKNLHKPLKSIFFPQREVLCSFEDDRVTDIPRASGRILTFGSRPCDAKTLLFLDKIFSSENGRFEDPYYLGRRENSLIISLVCSEPDDGCFCTSIDGGPADEKGSDILAWELGERILFEAITKKGKKFLEVYSARFGEPTDADMAAKEKIHEEARSSMSRFETEGLKEKLDSITDEKVWEEITATCLGCGICAYLCPTCHCFDINDETTADGGVRVRCWDSCQYPLFTMHASGHNPRPQQKQRMRQRIMHKFSFTPETVDEIFCVGCGRCVRECPVNLDIREIISSINGDK